MIGPQTAADIDNEFAVEEMEQTPSGYEVGVSEGVVADLTPVYDAAIQRLREQRRGLSARERLGALLIGFGQPTRHGRWQDAAANAAGMLFQQSLGRRKEDEDRRRELERLTNAREVAKIRSNATIEAARIRAAKNGGSDTLLTALGHKPNADEIKRLGIVRNRRPNFTPEQAVQSMYEPWVDRILVAPQIGAAAAGAGYAKDAESFLPPAMTVAEMRQWAEKSIAQGAPRDAVFDRMRQFGVPTDGL